MKENRGRKKGSYNYVMVSLDTLNKVLGRDGFVMVSKKYANTIGLVGQPVITRFHTNPNTDGVPTPMPVNPETIDDSSILSTDAPLVSVQDWN